MASKLGFDPTLSKKYYFISYNTEDSERVSKVLKGLLEQDIPLWYDDGIEYGTNWEPTIAKRIDKCRAMILFVTKGIFAKGLKSYVKKEWELAEFFGKKVIVIIMDEIDKKDISYDLISWWMAICAKQCIPALVYKDGALTKEIMKALGLKYKQAKIPGVGKNPFAYIAYGGRDVDAAEKLSNALEENDIKTLMPSMAPEAWGFDPRGPIKECTAIVALVSEGALRSRAFLNDISIGKSEGKTIIPILLENVSQYDLNRFQMYTEGITPVLINGNIDPISEEIRSIAIMIKG